MSKTKVKACKKCGCTDHDCSGCIEKTGYRCYWVDADLCSACADSVTLTQYLSNQIDWSKFTFGSTKRTIGIIKHIRKELLEIKKNPEDLQEWIDIIILALDGFWRHGGKPEEVMAQLLIKQGVNFKRLYPFPTSDDIPSEHIREKKK